MKKNKVKYCEFVIRNYAALLVLRMETKILAQ